MTAVRVDNLCKSFDGRRKALDRIDLARGACGIGPVFFEAASTTTPPRRS